MTNANEQHPLPVYFHDGGIFFMLHWWTYSDRGHVLLTRTEESMLRAAKVIFRENSDAEIKEYIEIEIVAPSKRLCHLAEIETRKQIITTLEVETRMYMKMLRDEGRALPAPFSECTTYDPPPDEEIADYSKENHYGCQNCSERIRCSLTPEALFEKYEKPWRAKFPIHPQRIDPKRKPSRARVPDDDEPLWCAHARSFGDHGKGIELLEVENIDDDSTYGQTFLSDCVLFFYKRGRRRRQLASIRELRAILREAEAKDQAERDERIAKDEADRDQRHKERLEAAYAVFATCLECNGTGKTEDDATGALGYHVNRVCSLCGGDGRSHA